MRIEQRVWSEPGGWTSPHPAAIDAADLVLVFGSTAALSESQRLAEIRDRYPSAHLLGCSTAGEIHGSRVVDDAVVTTAISFDHARLHAAHVALRDMRESFAAGERLGQMLPRQIIGEDGNAQSMSHVLVFSDGLYVNGSDLVRGLTSGLPEGVTITGGLAGDGARFQQTLVVSDANAAPRRIAATALYGAGLKIGYGSLGGWDPFGPERVVTRAEGNVLYELDGRSALQLYEQYLGEHANELPAAGLLFPLSIRTRAGEQPVVRTILGIDREQQSMTFAGDVPEGSFARLMKANFDRLIDGAVTAAQTGHRAMAGARPELALLISCVGRKLVLKQRIEEEVEGARDVLGSDVIVAGFYSYGEISPFTPGAKCELHNQTMTITTLSEP